MPKRQGPVRAGQRDRHPGRRGIAGVLVAYKPRFANRARAGSSRAVVARKGSQVCEFLAGKSGDSTDSITDK